MNLMKLKTTRPEKWILINLDKVDYVREFTRDDVCIICIGGREFEIGVTYNEIENELVKLK